LFIKNKIKDFIFDQEHWATPNVVQRKVKLSSQELIPSGLVVHQK
jgi:hypothetical protein